MEALSGVASGMAVASLSIQLIESIGEIKTFIHNFKDAQKELERLVDLLERLEALLEDVHALMEQQASLQAQHFPKPSMTIFKCLKSCEKTLEPLQSIIKDCTPSKSKTGTGMDRLKYGLKVAFKAKDIEGFETRIEREINFLHASLGANCGAILMQLGPALLSTRHIDEPMHQDPTAPSISIAHTKGLSSTPENTMVSHPVATRSSLSRTHVRSPLERIGIYRQRIVQRTPCSSRSRITDHEEEGGTIVSEHEETTIVWRMLGYGLTWIQHHSFGISMPSLSTFPVIKYFPDEIGAGLRTGEVHDFQDMFRRGVVHPFARDCDGFSLLHLAAMFGRADIYLLLRDLGVQQSLTKWESSPLLFAFEQDIHTEKSDRTTLCRCVFFDTTLVDDFTCSKWQSPQYPRGDTKPCQWLYSQASQVLPYEDSIAMKLKIIKDEWFKDCADLEKTGESTKRIFNFNPDADILDYIQRGRCSLLTHTILFTDRPYDSYLLGSMLIEWLLKAGIDVELFMDYECQHLRAIESAREPDSPCDFYKVVVFEGSRESGWVLGFEYELRSETPGYLVVSEYQALSMEIQRCEKWPFLNIDHHFWRWDWEKKCYERRFQRRMEAKARKERARTGQKIRKSKVPGMWVW